MFKGSHKNILQSEKNKFKPYWQFKHYGIYEAYKLIIIVVLLNCKPFPTIWSHIWLALQSGRQKAAKEVNLVIVNSMYDPNVM